MLIRVDVVLQDTHSPIMMTFCQCGCLLKTPSDTICTQHWIVNTALCLSSWVCPAHSHNHSFTHSLQLTLIISQAGFCCLGWWGWWRPPSHAHTHTSCPLLSRHVPAAPRHTPTDSSICSFRKARAQDTQTSKEDTKQRATGKSSYWLQQCNSLPWKRMRLNTRQHNTCFWPSHRQQRTKW